MTAHIVSHTTLYHRTNERTKPVRVVIWNTVMDATLSRSTAHTYIITQIQVQGKLACRPGSSIYVFSWQTYCVFVGFSIFAAWHQAHNISVPAALRCLLSLYTYSVPYIHNTSSLCLNFYNVYPWYVTYVPWMLQHAVCILSIATSKVEHEKGFFNEQRKYYCLLSSARRAHSRGTTRAYNLWDWTWDEDRGYIIVL